VSAWLFVTTRWAIYLRDGLACVYCDATIQELLEEADGNFLTVDHLRARTKGGRNDPANLVTCCYACNCAKGTKSLSAWCRAEGWDARSLRKRVARRARRPIENWRPAAKLIMGLVEGVPIAQMVIDHDWLVKRQFGDSIEGEHWEYLQGQADLFCGRCHGPVDHATGMHRPLDNSDIPF
jgi:hypothetical protein